MATEGLLSVATISFSPVVVWPRSLLLWPRSIVKGHSPHYFTQRRPQLQICIVEERSSLYIHLCIVVSVVGSFSSPTQEWNDICIDGMDSIHTSEMRRF